MLKSPAVQLFVVVVAKHWRGGVRKPAFVVGVYEWSEWKVPLAFVGKNIDDHLWLCCCCCCNFAEMKQQQLKHVAGGAHCLAEFAPGVHLALAELTELAAGAPAGALGALHVVVVLLEAEKPRH